MIRFSAPDILIIALYFAGVLFVGFRTTRSPQRSEEDFLLAGRSLTLPIFVMTLVSTWYGGILGVGEFSYRFGISNWIVQGVPYYFFAAMFAIFLAKKIRSTNLFSIPDKLEAAYDKKTSLLGSLLIFVLMTPAPYILMLSTLLQMVFGWSLLASLCVTAATTVSYLFWGGFRSDVQTDILEFILMFIGFAVILPFSFIKFGGFGYLEEHLPALHLTWHGGNSYQFIIVWFFIALWTFVDPAFHQRCYAAKNEIIAKKGILLSIIFWFIFDLMTVTAGLYARAALPHLDKPMMAFPMLGESVLPPIAKGLFFVGLLATIMSTLNTLAFISAQTLGRDIAGRLFFRDDANRIGSKSEIMTLYTRVGIIVSFILSIAIALTIPSIVRIWYTIGTVIIPGLLVPLIASYFERLRITSRFAFTAMLTGSATSLAWLISGQTGGTLSGYPLGIEPMYPGLAATLLIWFVGRRELKNRMGLKAVGGR